MKKNPVIIISGPTASGKTDTALFLAQTLKLEKNLSCSIVNFDSLLFYKELNIGTAKPTEDQLKAVPHFMINTNSYKDPLNASDYIQQAQEIINNEHALGHVVLLVGGSGFYLRALIKGMYQSGGCDEKLRKEVDRIYQEQGIQPIIAFLKKHDPDTVAQLHPNDHYRLIRAYEHFRSTGSPFSIEKKKMDDFGPYNFAQSAHPQWNLLHIYLDLPKEEHIKIVEKRAKKMLNNGLIEEITSILKAGASGGEKPLQSIGYKETISYLKGEYSSQEDCLERIVISTRQLAKSQRTFFKKISPKKLYHPLQDKQKILSDVMEFLT